MAKQWIAVENLALTDNPSVLRVPEEARKFNETRVAKTLKQRFLRGRQEAIIDIRPPEDQDTKPAGNPILLKIPIEAVTPIHTPGSPTDHQGYFVLLDELGNPIDATVQNRMANRIPTSTLDGTSRPLIDNVFSAYGLPSEVGQMSRIKALQSMYTHVVGSQLESKLKKAGFENSEFVRSDPLFRCMFARFLEHKQTRVLYLPKELVTYMTFKKDEYGIGKSRLDYIRFSMGMKLTLQVSRALAAVKAAMDKRNISVRVTDQYMESPEQLINNVLREFVNKNSISFNTNPDIIQQQIVSKSVGVKIQGIPGLEDFDVTNEPGNNSSTFDFDSGISDQLDQDIISGLNIPPSVMNSLGEDEYARSVVTGNLFFNMDINSDQVVVKYFLGDLVRKYGTYSEELIDIISHVISDQKNPSDDSDSSAALGIPAGYSVGDIINKLIVELPKPNIAPNKAQFEILDAMVQSISAAVMALLPDELTGGDEAKGVALRLIRTRIIIANVRTYLERSGMSDLDVPDYDFAKYLSDSDKALDALENVSKMLELKAKVGKAAETGDVLSDTGSGDQGFGAGY
jgi:hypothetical protein